MLRVTVVRWCVDATLAFLRGSFFGVEWRRGFRGAPAVDVNDVGVDTAAAAAAATINDDDDDDDDIVEIVYMRVGTVRSVMCTVECRVSSVEVLSWAFPFLCRIWLLASFLLSSFIFSFVATVIEGFRTRLEYVTT